MESVQIIDSELIMFFEQGLNSWFFTVEVFIKNLTAEQVD